MEISYSLGYDAASVTIICCLCYPCSGASCWAL